MSERVVSEARDEGLRREVGAWGLGANVFNTVVGAGIFVLPAALSREMGAAAPLAYLACTIVMGGVVVCFAAAGSRTPTSGGPYGYAAAAFGPFVGFLVGVLVWLGAVLAAAGVSAALADAAARLIPELAGPGWRILLVTLVLAGLAAVNVAGVGLGSGLVGVTTVLKLAPIALLLAVGAFHVDPANLRPAAGAALGSELGRAMLLAIFAFQGMETALAVSGEVRDPARNVPRGLLGAMAAIAVLYVAIQVVVQGVLGPELAASAAPLADAARAAWTPLGAVLLAGTLASMFGYLAGDTLSAPRMLFAFGRDGYLPRVMATIHPPTGAPWVAIVVHVVVAVALAATGGFVQLATLSALASVGVYVVGCAAAVVLQRRGTALAGPPLRVPGLWLAALVGIGGMAWLTANARPAEIGGLGATLAASAVLYAVVSRRRRGRQDALS